MALCTDARLSAVPRAREHLRFYMAIALYLIILYDIDIDDDEDNAQTD